MNIRRMAWGLTLVWGLGTALPGVAAAREANTKENNTRAAAVGLTAASAVLLSKKNTRATGVAVGLGAAYAWKKHHDYVEQRHKDSSRRVYYVRGGKRYVRYEKRGPNGKAWGYYNRSAHSTYKAAPRGKKWAKGPAFHK